MSEEGCGCRKPPGEHESFCPVPHQEEIERLENKLVTELDRNTALEAKLKEEWRPRDEENQIKLSAVTIERDRRGELLRLAEQKAAAMTARAERLKKAGKDWRSLSLDQDWGSPKGFEKLRAYEKQMDQALAFCDKTNEEILKRGNDADG